VTVAPAHGLVARDGAMRALLDTGVARLVLRLDAPDAERHDAAVGFEGAFAAMLRAVETASRRGIPLDVETRVDAATIGRLEATGVRVASLGPERWRVVFTVPCVGAPPGGRLAADAIELALRRLYRWRIRHGTVVETEAAPAFNRIVAQRDASRRVAGAAWPRPLPVNDGKGLLHLSPGGDVYPSRWLPLSPGNVREERLGDVYRRSRLFRALRDAGRLEGRCGRCRFRAICGGSRARAWAATGSFLAEDPGCTYRPPVWSEPPTSGS
jgi:radical SAM protein with 4Fe4S-binding SPASM domain